MKRAIVLAISVILALVVAAPTVLAQDEGSPNGVPPGDPIPSSFTLDPKDPDAPPTSTASFGCIGFPLHFELTGKTKTIELPDGFIVTSPGLDVTVTNEVTGEQLTFNITGSSHGTPRPDDSGIVDYVITGRNLALDPFGVFLNKGRFTFTLDQSDPENIIIVEPQEGKGQAIDVCELLS